MEISHVKAYSMNLRIVCIDCRCALTGAHGYSVTESDFARDSLSRLTIAREADIIRPSKDLSNGLSLL